MILLLGAGVQVTLARDDEPVDSTTSTSLPHGNASSRTASALIFSTDRSDDVVITRPTSQGSRPRIESNLSRCASVLLS